MKQPKNIHRVTTIIRAVETLCPDVVALELEDPDGWDLPPFKPGAHIDVYLPRGLVRQYSLFGDPAISNGYRIAIRLEKDGRGGSLCVHSDLKQGDTLLVSLPRNHFPIASAPYHLLIAGGIGITPFLSMIAEMRRTGTAFSLHYFSRAPGDTPFIEHLGAMAGEGLVHHHFSRTGTGRVNPASLLKDLPEDAHIYCCGPDGLIEAISSSMPDDMKERFHVERFGAGGAGRTALMKSSCPARGRSFRFLPVRLC